MWQDKPTKIESKIRDNSFIVAIDESGTNYITPDNDLYRYFTMGAVIIPENEFDTVEKMIIELKNKYWVNGVFDNKKVVLRSRDIKKGAGAFHKNIINREEFIEDLKTLLNEIKVMLICVNFDKSKLYDGFSSDRVYTYATEMIFERIAYELQSNGKKSIVIMESRGRKEDRITLNKVKFLNKSGNEFVRNVFFRNINGVYFNPKRSSCGLKSYWSLEIADLLTYIVHRNITKNDNSEEFDVIKTKFRNYPNYNSYGLKKFP